MDRQSSKSKKHNSFDRYSTIFEDWYYVDKNEDYVFLNAAGIQHIRFTKQEQKILGNPEIKVKRKAYLLKRIFGGSIIN